MQTKFINLDHTKQLIKVHPDCKQLISLPNGDVVEKDIDQVIDVIDDDLKYLVHPNIDIKNLTINIMILPIVESA